MKNYLRRFYPYQALRLAIQSIRTAGSLKKVTPLPTLACRQKQAAVLHDARSIEHLLQRIHDSSLTSHPDRLSLIQNKLGFMVYKKPSFLQNAGTGVFLKGSCKSGQVVCLYPGTVYLPSEPLLFASLANQYILKCYDGVYIDGKLTGLSGYIHRSLYHRENWPGATQISDMTWMTDVPRNPLAIGQIVNNGTKNYPANVYYQEIDLPMDFPRYLRQWIPNIYWCNMDPFTNSTRVVALVALRDIDNEEVLSTYMDAF
ncbi:hypothetical protein BCR42DRAFT_407385 [Absidia repens]|uniref:SET domain-containing protein n=1 Tax=Absidia repens TaxID=90262 RepID=A0A1X2IS66_9FUNG|nr:hypothetical protein BCR42DRAFT_407385 [Absidia repens]